MITWPCPQCKQSLSVPDTSAGKRGKCRECNTPVQIPNASPRDHASMLEEPSPRAASEGKGLSDSRQRPTSAIFISYRRADSMDATGRIHDRLTEHFGRESIFIDVDTIPRGWISASTSAWLSVGARCCGR